MYAFVQQQQQRRRQQEEQQQQQQQQSSPYWPPQPAAPPVPVTVIPTFHNNSALAAHSPMARYQSSLHAHAHAEALSRHPWSVNPSSATASPAPSLHRQPAPPSPAMSNIPWRPSLASPLLPQPQSIKRASDSLLQPNSPTVTRILVPVRPQILPPPVMARNKTPLIPSNPMTKAATAAPARQLPQPSLNASSPYQMWIPPPQSSPTSDQDLKALWLPPPGFNSTRNRQLIHLDLDSSDPSDDSDDSSNSSNPSDTRAYHAIVGPLSASLPSKSSMSTRLLDHTGIWRTPEATRDPPPRYQLDPTSNDGSPPSRIPISIRNPKLSPLSQSTSAPRKSSTAANTPRSTPTPSARLTALKSPNNMNTKSPANTIRLPLIKGAQLKKKPPLPLPKNLANTPSSTRLEMTTTTLGGGATPARPVIGLDLSPKVRKNSLSTPRTLRSPITKLPSAAAHPPNNRAGARAAARPKSRSLSISSRRTSVSSSFPHEATKSPPVPTLPSKAIATAIPPPAVESEPTSSARAATRTSPSAALAPAPPPMTSDELDALPEIIVNEKEAAIPEDFPLPVPPMRDSLPPPASPSVPPSASPRNDVKPLMVTLPSQVKNTTTVKIVKETLPDPPPQSQLQPQPQPRAHPISSPQGSPNVAPKPVPAVNKGANDVQAKIQAYNERDEIRKRTLSVEVPQQREREGEEEEVMEIEAREIPQSRRHSVDSNIDFRPHGQPLQITYPGHPGHAPRSTGPSPWMGSVPMQPTDGRPRPPAHSPVQAQAPIHERRRLSNSTGGAPSVMTKSSSGSSRFGTEYSIPDARNGHSKGSNASGGKAPPQMASLASPEVMDVSLVGPFTPPQPPVDDRSSRRRLAKRPPPSMQADPHARIIADDAPRGRQSSPYHNRNPSPARAPSVASFEDSLTVSNNAPLLAPRPQPLAVVNHEPPRLAKQSSSGGSSSGGSSSQIHQVQVQGRSRKRRHIPPPQPIPVPGAPDYSRPTPPPQQLPLAQHMQGATMVLNGSPVASYLRPSQPFTPSPHHPLPHPSQMDNQLYSSVPLPPSLNVNGKPAPEVNTEPQSPRDFANPGHFRHRPKVLSVPTPLAPHLQGNGQTAPSNVMMMSPPYQVQQRPAAALPEFYSPAAAGAASVPTPLFPSPNPYQGHWQPEPQQQYLLMRRPLPRPPQQQHHQQQQGRQGGHQYSRSESRMIEFPSAPMPSTQDGYYMGARRPNAEMQVTDSSDLLSQPVPRPVQARLSPPMQRGHTKSMSDFGPAKMSASTIARLLQAQRGSPNASSTSLNKFPTNASSTSLNKLPANASSTSLAQQAQVQAQSQPPVPEVRTNTHRSNSPVRLAPPADQAQAPPYTQAQQPRVLRRETPPPQAASAPILMRSNSPAGPGRSLGQAYSRGFASSDALLEGSNNGDNSSSSSVSMHTHTLTPPVRKISFDVPHGPEQDPPAAAAAPKKRRQRGRPTNPEDNMFVDPFGFTITEATPYDVIEKMTAGKKDVQAEPQFPTYRENFVAKTNAMRAQGEVEAKERGRQEGSKLRRGGSPISRQYSPSRGSPRGSPEPSGRHYKENGPRDPLMRLYQNDPLSQSQQHLPSQQPSRPFLGRMGRSSSADSTHNKLRKPRDRSQSPGGYILPHALPQYRDMSTPSPPRRPVPALPPNRPVIPGGALHKHMYSNSVDSSGRPRTSSVASTLRSKLTKR